MYRPQQSLSCRWRYSDSSSDRQKTESPLHSSWIRRLKPREDAGAAADHRLKLTNSFKMTSAKANSEQLDRACSESPGISLKEPSSMSTKSHRTSASGWSFLFKGNVQPDIRQNKESGASDLQESRCTKMNNIDLSNHEAGSDTIEASTVVQLTNSGFQPWVNLTPSRKSTANQHSELECAGLMCSSIKNGKTVINTKTVKQFLESSFRRGSHVLHNTASPGKPPLPPLKNRPPLYPEKLLLSKSDQGVLCQSFSDITAQERHDNKGQALLDICLRSTERELSQVISGHGKSDQGVLCQSFSNITAQERHDNRGQASLDVCIRSTERELSQVISAHEKQVSHASWSRTAPQLEKSRSLVLASTIHEADNCYGSAGHFSYPVENSGASHNFMMESITGNSSQVSIGINDMPERPKDSNILINVDCESVPSTDLSLKISHGDSCTIKTSESLKQSPSFEPKRIPARYAGAGCISSKPRGSSLDLFGEALGATQKDREQFMEVYNQARNDLKNQRTSLIINKPPSGQVFSASGHKVDNSQQSLKHLKHGTLSMSLEHRSQSSNTPAHESLNHLRNGDSQVHRKGGTLSICLEHRTESSNTRNFQFQEQGQSTVTIPEGESYFIQSGEGLYQDTANKSRSASLCRQSDQHMLGEQGINHKETSGRIQECKKLKQKSTALVQDHNQYEPYAILNQDKNQSKNIHEQPLGKEKQEITTVLGKRHRGAFEDNTISKLAPLAPHGGELPPSKYNFWIQRWYTTATRHREGLSKNTSDGIKHGMKDFKDGRAAEVTNTLTENKDQAASKVQVQSAKILPSAAAMAIVGTAARQFCTTQPQRKRSFGFWSGFGTFTS